MMILSSEKSKAGFWVVFFMCHAYYTVLLYCMMQNFSLHLLECMHLTHISGLKKLTGFHSQNVIKFPACLFTCANKYEGISNEETE